MPRRVAESPDEKLARVALAVALECIRDDWRVSHLRVCAALRADFPNVSPSEVWRALMSHTPGADTGNRIFGLARDPASGYFTAPQHEPTALEA